MEINGIFIGYVDNTQKGAYGFIIFENRLR